MHPPVHRVERPTCSPGLRTVRLGLLLLTQACAPEAFLQGGSFQDQEAVRAAIEHFRSEIREDLWPDVASIQFVGGMHDALTARRGHDFHIVLPSGIDPRLIEPTVRHELCHVLDAQSPRPSVERTTWPILPSIPVSVDTDDMWRRELFGYLCELGVEGLERLHTSGAACLTDGVEQAAGEILDEFFEPGARPDWGTASATVTEAPWREQAFWPTLVSPVWVWKTDHEILVDTTRFRTSFGLDVVTGAWDDAPFYGGTWSAATLVDRGRKPPLSNIWVRDRYALGDAEVEAWHIDLVWGDVVGALAWRTDTTTVLPACVRGTPTVVADADLLVGIAVGQDGATVIRYDRADGGP